MCLKKLWSIILESYCTVTISKEFLIDFELLSRLALLIHNSSWFTLIYLFLLFFGSPFRIYSLILQCILDLRRRWHLDPCVFNIRFGISFFISMFFKFLHVCCSLIARHLSLHLLHLRHLRHHLLTRISLHVFLIMTLHRSLHIWHLSLHPSRHLPLHMRHLRMHLTRHWLLVAIALRVLPILTLWLTVLRRLRDNLRCLNLCNRFWLLGFRFKFLELLGLL